VFLSNGCQDIETHIAFAMCVSFFSCLALLHYSYHIHVFICREKLVYFQHCCIGPNFAIIRFFHLSKKQSKQNESTIVYYVWHSLLVVSVRP